MMPSEKSDISAPPKMAEKVSRLRQRQKLVEACISALYQHGPSRTTIDKVVAIADMSPGIVNFYFETKAALLVAALEFLAEEFEDRVLAPLAALREEPVQALRKLIALYLDADIASPRKVSVWYAFWGEASSRSEYYAICGKRDEAFADLVRDLVERLIRETASEHLDADAVALGLIGALEMIWQEIAFHDEADLDRHAARQRCIAYLRSVFPAQFGAIELRKYVVPPVSELAAGSGAAATKARAGAQHAELGFMMLAAAEFTLAGVPASLATGFGAGYDIIAQPANGGPQRIAVSVCPFEPGAAFADDCYGDTFDWLAMVVLPLEASGRRRIFVIPNAELREVSRRRDRLPNGDEVMRRFGAYENNFRLVLRGQTMNGKK